MANTFNGWTNWATWNVELWLDNDEGLYREKQRFIRRSYREIDGDDVRRFCVEIFPTGTPDMQGQIEMAPVDWDQLAEHWDDERKEYEAA